MNYELMYDIALTMTPGLGVRGIVHLLEYFESAEKIFNASEAELIHFARINPKVAKAIVSHQSFAQAEREVEYCSRNNITPIASTDPRFPTLLKLISDYPHVLYVMGNIEALSGHNVSIVGTRRMSSYGDRMCHDLVMGLSNSLQGNVTIISGLAFGIDAAAHRAALHFGATTVAVLANALPSVSPSQHTSLAADILAQGGALVSEYHSQSKQRGGFYIARNRIIAALSPVTVVVESPLTGGSMATASIAHGYDRSVMAIPGRLTDPNCAGCNTLIRNNQAQLLISAEQLIREMMWDTPNAADRNLIEPLSSPAEYSPQQAVIMSAFSQNEPLSAQYLASISGLNAQNLSAILTELELLGAIRMLPGNRYEQLNAVVAR
ncbi:MAG: DNA-processing protein DprA [Rikenellaceae bacterium]